MLAARLLEGESRLRLEHVPVPEPHGDQVLVEVTGCGVCRSDLHVLDGMFPELVRRPVTPGHEIAGRVAAAGPGVGDLGPGDPVAVMVGWGCGRCEWCVSGREQLCPEGDEAGATVDGGFAEYVLVPHRRHLVPLGELDPLAATPLGCAGITAYAAVERARPALPGRATAVVLGGGGGLGQAAVQLLGALTGAQVVAVEADAERRARALEQGAAAALAPHEAAEAVAELSEGRRAHAVLDFVGSDETLALAAELVRPRGLVALVGLAGGTLPYTFFRLAPEATLTTVVAGGIADLQQTVRLARAGVLRIPVEPYPLARVEDALADLRAGRVRGRAVVVPSP